MAHLRSAIFEAVRSRLQAIGEFGGAGKVERGRTRAIPQELLPALSLTWADDDERATLRQGFAPDENAVLVNGYDRVLPISIIVHVRDADPEQEFDRICVLIEKALAADIVLPGLTIEVLLSSSRFFVDRTTGLPLMAGRLVYQCFYKAVADDPEKPMV